MNRPTYDRSYEPDWRHWVFWATAAGLIGSAILKRIME